MMGAEMERWSYNPKNARGCWKPAEVRTTQGRIPPKSLQGSVAQPTPSSRLKPPELREYIPIKVTKFLVICYGGPRKRIYLATKYIYVFIIFTVLILHYIYLLF